MAEADATVYIWFLGQIYSMLIKAGNIPLHPLKSGQTWFFCEDENEFWHSVPHICSKLEKEGGGGRLT